MVAVADHLGWCRARPADRLARLVTLSSAAPDDALPRILGATDRILSTPPGTQALEGEDNSALRRELAGILARALTAADDVLVPDADCDIATAAEALGRAAPSETAQILIDRAVSETLRLIPYYWEGLLLQAPFEQREALAAANQERLAPLLGSLPEQAEAIALDVLAILGRDSPRWAALVRGWAAGNAANRSRAATAIRRRWQDPIWRELVPELLDAGLSEHCASNLRHGILPLNDAIDATGIASRLDALQSLLDDPRPVVSQFATEATRSLHSLLPASWQPCPEGQENQG